MTTHYFERCFTNYGDNIESDFSPSVIEIWFCHCSKQFESWDALDHHIYSEG